MTFHQHFDKFLLFATIKLYFSFNFLIMNKSFDVIVIGGGHAGVEAAHAAARAGSSVLLITLKKEKIGHMPCNPAVGGIGKGHIVYEISALGGVMPKICSKSYLQARMLNTKKGPAVQGLRLQIDKHVYAKECQKLLEHTKNLEILEDKVDGFLFDESAKSVLGVQCAKNGKIRSKTVVVTTGTFLKGLIHIGTYNEKAGRRGEEAVYTLSDELRKLGLKLGRLKTGTPPRLCKKSLDFSKMKIQEEETLSYLFEFYPQDVKQKTPCYITYTNNKTHEIIRENLHKSAMYNGNIEGIGPRYCPSIEDKISRFAGKESHLVFVEPETENAESESYEEIYPNGLSTSLPADVQEKYIQSIVGFENAKIKKIGYAVEYDFVHPNQLKSTLEIASISGLFLAGQINGTTGYEEAAGQGIVAGINAHQKAHKKEEFIFDRSESYIGVMVDDLISVGIDEPYRMFTSRAERRLILRQDNVFLRLMDRGFSLGLVDQKTYRDFCTEKEIIFEALMLLRKNFTLSVLMKKFGQSEDDIPPLKEYLLQENFNKDLLSQRALLCIHAEIRYEPYITRELQEIKKREQYKKLKIPVDFSFKDMPGLSKELQQKLIKYQPATIADVELIPGMTPAAITLLIFKINTKSR